MAPFHRYIVCAMLVVIAAGAAAATASAEQNDTSQDNSTIAAVAFISQSTPPPLPSPDICTVCRCSKELLCPRQNLTATSLNETLWSAEGGILATINLSNNIIGALHRVPDRVNITDIDLSHNAIASIDWNALAGFSSLRQLNLSDNLLTYDSFLPAIFDDNQTTTPVGLPHLSQLDLAGNQLHSLPLATFGPMPALQKLLLARNSFAYLYGPTVESLASLPALKWLELSDNQLTTLPPRFLERLPQLDVLLLDGNRFVTVPAALRLAPHLKSLALGSNPMGNLEGDNVFPNMSSLISLSLDNLPHLHRVGAHALSGLRALKTLQLFNNSQLSDIDGDALSWVEASSSSSSSSNRTWPSLDELNLSRNNLTDIRPGLLGLQQWQDIRYVQLQSNPWTCTCSPRWLQNGLMPVIRLKMSWSARCGPYSDPPVRDFALEYVGHYVENGHCNQYSVEVILLVSIFLSLFCLVLGCILRLIKRIKLRAVDPDGRGLYKQV